MNEIKNIKSSISKILDLGGKISFDYKYSLDSWYSEVYIVYFTLNDEYFIHETPDHGTRLPCYKDKKIAIQKFVNFIFSENNLAYVIKRLEKRVNFNAEDYDFKEPTQELLDLIEEEKNLIKNGR